MRTQVRGRQRRATGVVSWCTSTLLALAGLVLGAAPASAHAELVSSTPKDGASVATLPATVELTFSEAVGSVGAYVAVTDPAGDEVGVGEPDVVDGTVTLKTTGAGPAGDYTLAYRVVSADGHPVSGDVGFTVETASDADPGPDADAGTDPGPGTEPGSARGSDAEPASAAADDAAAQEGFVSRHATHIGLAALGLVAAAVLLGVGVRGRHSH